MTSLHAVFPEDSHRSADNLAEHSDFEVLVRTYSGVVLGVCLRLLKDRSAAEDACQETFLSAWRHRERLTPNRGWLIKVATNKCLDQLRSQGRRPVHKLNEHAGETMRLASPEPSPESVAMEAQTMAILDQALSRLPESQRATIVLAEFHGWRYQEIAETYGVSLGTVKSRVFRARASLRRVLEGSLTVHRA